MGTNWLFEPKLLNKKLHLLVLAPLQVALIPYADENYVYDEASNMQAPLDTGLSVQHGKKITTFSKKALQELTSLIMGELIRLKHRSDYFLKTYGLVLANGLRHDVLQQHSIISTVYTGQRARVTLETGEENHSVRIHAIKQLPDIIFDPEISCWASEHDQVPTFPVNMNEALFEFVWGELSMMHEFHVEFVDSRPEHFAFKHTGQRRIFVLDNSTVFHMNSRWTLKRTGFVSMKKIFNQEHINDALKVGLKQWQQWIAASHCMVQREDDEYPHLLEAEELLERVDVMLFNLKLAISESSSSTPLSSSSDMIQVISSFLKKSFPELAVVDGQSLISHCQKETTAGGVGRCGIFKWPQAE